MPLPSSTPARTLPGRDALLSARTPGSRGVGGAALRRGVARLVLILGLGLGASACRWERTVSLGIDGESASASESATTRGEGATEADTGATTGGAVTGSESGGSSTGGSSTDGEDMSSSGTGADDPCAPAADDDDCTLCVKGSCCEHFDSCGDDPRCDCMLRCIADASPPALCVSLCEPGKVYATYVACRAKQCAPQCTP